MGRKKNSIGHQLKYYCYMLNVADEACVKPRGYQLQRALGLLPAQLGKEKGHRNNKWDRYFYFKDKTPSKPTLNQIQKRFKRSNFIFTLPLWEIMDTPYHACESIITLLLKMPVNIKRHLFQLHSPYEIKIEISSRAIEAIERIGTEDALACLLGLFTLEVNKRIYLGINENIEGSIERLLKRCCLRPPLDKIKGQLHDEIVKYINTPYDIPNDYIILESQERFLYQVKNLKIVFNALQKMHITERKTTELELTYWLMKGNDAEILADLERINKKLPLMNKNEGLLWIFQHMMYQTKGMMKNRIAFLYDFFLKGDYSITNPHYFDRYSSLYK